MQAHGPAGAGHLWHVGPSTRGATAPQGAQLVNFVVRRCRSVALGHGWPRAYWLRSTCSGMAGYHRKSKVGHFSI